MHVILDARMLGEKQQAHQYLKEIFRFPDYYGCNLDALYDCLSEQRDLHIHLLHTDQAGEYFEKVLSVFQDLDEGSLRILS